MRSAIDEKDTYRTASHSPKRYPFVSRRSMPDVALMLGLAHFVLDGVDSRTHGACSSYYEIFKQRRLGVIWSLCRHISYYETFK